MPYCLPFQAPRSTQPLLKFLSNWALASGPSGLSQPLSANWCNTPTCGRNATSGGWPPWILVPRNVEVLLPVGTKLTFAPVRFLNSSMTFMKLSCSAPVQTAATSSVWPFSLGSLTEPELPELPPPLLLLSPPPPQPVSASASAAARRAAADLAALRVRFLLLVLRITAPFSVLRRTSSAVPCDLVYACGVGSASVRPLSTGGS